MNGAVVEAVHAHVGGAVTSTNPDPPSGPNDWLSGEIDVAHEPGPACVNVTVMPATVTVPVRGRLAFPLTPITTVPDPVPDALFVIVRNALLLAAVQLHDEPWVTVTLTVTFVGAEETSKLVGLTAKLHWPGAGVGDGLGVGLGVGVGVGVGAGGAGAELPSAACEIVTVVPATVSDADRAPP